MENYVEKVRDIMKANDTKLVRTWCLIDLGGELDEDGDELPIVADVICMQGDTIFLFDSADVAKDGSVDPVWELSELDERTQKDTLWTLNKTLEENRKTEKIGR